MEINWSTFALEIVNFLVLVWILKRFLYRPVLNVIAQRRAGIEQTLSQAETVRTEAKQLQQQYENRLQDWATEQQRSRDKLRVEVDAERQTLLDKLHKEIDKERERIAVLTEREQATAQRVGEEQAFTLAARFTASLLNKLSGPELEALLIKLFVSEITALSTEKLKALRSQWKSASGEIAVSSSFDLSNAQQTELSKCLKALSQQDLVVNYSVDSSLIAGLRISMGDWILQANLANELHGFMQLGQVNAAT